MSRLLESIKLLDGRFCNLQYHEQRMARALQSLFRTGTSPALEQSLAYLPVPQVGLYKCRIVYDNTSREITVDPYVPRSIRSVRLVYEDRISYAFKFVDRASINRLYDQRGDCDDVMIIRDGKVTDCSYTNIAFRKGAEWFTPDSPLLEGIMRRKLIDENKIKVREIRAIDIRSFDGFKLINAMLEFESPEIEVSNIVF